MLERLRAHMRAKRQRNFPAARLASWVFLPVCLDWPGNASASVYPDGFAWQRAGDWKTSGGTPTTASKLDSQGNAVWNYSWVSGGDFSGSSGTNPWWQLARTDLPPGQWWQVTFNVKLDAVYQDIATLRDAPVTRTFRFRQDGAPSVGLDDPGPATPGVPSNPRFPFWPVTPPPTVSPSVSFPPIPHRLPRAGVRRHRCRR